MTADLRKMARIFFGLVHESSPDDCRVDSLVGLFARVRSEALDDAAKECDAMAEEPGVGIMAECAFRIRALATKGAAGR